MNLRKVLKYSPFCDIILIRFSGISLDEIKKSSNFIYRNLKKYLNKIENLIIFEPVPAPIDRIKNKYRWRIIIKGKVTNSMIDLINHSFEGMKNLKSTTITVDINPSNMS